jgi:hypothetical protein
MQKLRAGFNHLPIPILGTICPQVKHANLQKRSYLLPSTDIRISRLENVALNLCGEETVPVQQFVTIPLHERKSPVSDAAAEALEKPCCPYYWI